MPGYDFAPADILSVAHPGIKYAGHNCETENQDAHFIIRLPRKIAKGWYHLEMEMGGDDGLEPRAAFDLNREYFDEYEAPLFPGIADRYGVYIYLPDKSNTVRLYPHSRDIGFKLGEIFIRPLGSGFFSTMMAKTLHFVGKKYNQFIPDEATGPLPRNPKYFSYFDFETNRLVVVKSSYRVWMEKFDYRSSQKNDYERKIKTLENPPLISILMPVFDPDINDLDDAINSVHGQLYPNWELCIADDCSTNPAIREIIKRWANRDSRIKFTLLDQRGHISLATNAAFKLASGSLIALMDHDDILREHALAEIALTASANPDAEIIYSDEDKISPDGRRYDPYFKCDWSPDLFHGQNYLNHLTVHRADNIRAVGGWREGFEGAQDYDLILRIMERISEGSIHHIPKILYHWRAAQTSMAAGGDNKSYAHAAGQRALEEHFVRSGTRASVEPNPPYYHVSYEVPEPAPLVSLIIPTRDRGDILKSCISSILDKTDYPNYEIIVVDNGSTEIETLTYLDQISGHEKISVLEYSKPFNFSAINNFAVGKATGKVIALVNNDVEIISPQWLSLMVGQALRPEIGCVGAKLYYPNERIQHAGVILGLGGVAGHAHKYFRRSHHGYFSRLMLTQNVSAVTAACLVVRREVYGEVGGLDEDNLTIAFNDVDFCLKVREKGYLNLFEPRAELYHHESISRGREDTPEKRRRFRAEVNYMKRRWGGVLFTDPYYSPHLSLKSEDFSISH